MQYANRPIITPAEWDCIATRRIQLVGEEWNDLSVDDRFWIVFNWLKEYQILDPDKTQRQLFMCKPYWEQ